MSFGSRDTSTFPNAAAVFKANAANAPASTGVPTPPSLTDKDIQAAGEAARASAAAAIGRASTILTSGKGVADAPETRKKTLLGA